MSQCVHVTATVSLAFILVVCAVVKEWVVCYGMARVYSGIDNYSFQLTDFYGRKIINKIPLSLTGKSQFCGEHVT